MKKLLITLGLALITACGSNSNGDKNHAKHLPFFPPNGRYLLVSQTVNIQNHQFSYMINGELFENIKGNTITTTGYAELTLDHVNYSVFDCNSVNGVTSYYNEGSTWSAVTSSNCSIHNYTKDGSHVNSSGVILRSFSFIKTGTGFKTILDTVIEGFVARIISSYTHTLTI
jgi:hypothetical protein